MALDVSIKAKGDEIIPIASKHGANHVRLFGSAARGEASDMVKFERDAIWDAGTIR
jgi:predicted nucleotidyltransferase